MAWQRLRIVLRLSSPYFCVLQACIPTCGLNEPEILLFFRKILRVFQAIRLCCRKTLLRFRKIHLHCPMLLDLNPVWQ
jgi:hypothetical protein